LACHCNLNDEIPTTKIQRQNQTGKQAAIINEIFDKEKATNIYKAKVNVDTTMLHNGGFKNIMLIESPLKSLISCVTTIYSYGKKILETREKRCFMNCNKGGYIYRFDFGGDYWTAFFNGLICLPKDEADLALESILMTQVMLF
jgi:hypothetical protein